MDTNPSIILCSNDLESGFIIDLCTARNIEPVIFELDWGELPPLYDARLDPAGLGDDVILIEMPNPPLEERLRVAGKRVTIIDHHTVTMTDGKPVDRSSPRCAAFQLVRHMGWKLSEQENLKLQAVEANDAGSWFALMRLYAALPLQEAEEAAQKIRNAECEIRARFGHNKNSHCHDWTYWCAGRDKVPVDVSLNKNGEGGYYARTLHSGLENAGHRTFHVVCGPACHILIAGEAYQKHLAIRAHRDKDYNKRKEIEAPEILFLGFEDNSAKTPRIEKMFFTGGSVTVKLVKDIIRQTVDNPDPDLQLVSGGGAKGVYLYAFGRGENLGTLADLIINNAVHGTRPVAKWQSSFFQALQLPDGMINWSSPHLQVESAKKTTFGLCELGPSARNYFLPALQPMVAPTIKQAKASLKQTGGPDCEASPLTSWIIPVARKFSLTVQNINQNAPDGYGFQLEEPLKALIVHRGFGNLVYLEWRFDNEDRAVLRKKSFTTSPLWQVLCDPRTKIHLRKRVSTAAQVLDFNYAARMCFSAGERGPGDQRIISLSKQGATSDCDETACTWFGIGDAENSYRPEGWFGLLVGHALKHMSGQSAPSLDNVKIMMDERARFVSTLVPLGNPASLPTGIDRSEVLRARFAGGDEFSDNHFYDVAFSLEELNKSTYRRFAPETLYQATSHSFTALTHGFFGNVLALDHMRDHYARMFLVTQSVVSTFQSLWQALVRHSTGHDGDVHQAEQRAQENRRKMVSFSNGFWFHSLSHQLQGEELYELMRKQLPVEREQKELNEEIANTQLLATDERAKRDEEGRDRLTLVIGIFALFVAFIEVAREWVWLDTGKQAAVPLLWMAGIGGIAVVGGWALAKWRRRSRR